MKKIFINTFLFFPVSISLNVKAEIMSYYDYNQNNFLMTNEIPQYPNCASVHVWYTLNNKDPKYSWYIQISRLFENNINFLDENCNKINMNKKIEIPSNHTRIVGMEVTTPKSFNTIYSFTGVRNDEALPLVPNNKYACIYVISAYGPGQLNRMDWKLNNADCVSSNLGTQIDFK